MELYPCTAHFLRYHALLDTSSPNCHQTPIFAFPHQWQALLYFDSAFPLIDPDSVQAVLRYKAEAIVNLT